MSYLLTELNEYEREVREERKRQDLKWGEQNHPDGTGDTFRVEASMAREECNRAHRAGIVTWRHILEEEVFEAFATETEEELLAELVQVEAVARAWRESIHRRQAKRDGV